MKASDEFMRERELAKDLEDLLGVLRMFTAPTANIATVEGRLALGEAILAARAAIAKAEGRAS